MTPKTRQQKHDAIQSLKAWITCLVNDAAVIPGDEQILRDHLVTLRNGRLGDMLRQRVVKGEFDTWFAPVKPRTVSEFVEQLIRSCQEKRQPTPLVTSSVT